MIIHPFRTSGTKDFSIISIGMISAANILKFMGHEVLGINMPMEQALRPGERITVNEYLKKFQPELVLVSLHWYEFYAGAVAVSKEVHDYDPHMLCAAAGMSATILEKYLLTHHLFDYIIKDGESFCL